MAEQLNADLNIIQRSGIEITVDPLTKDLNIIQKLDDEPNDVGGLSAQDLKEKFDEAGNVIKDYINDSLIPQVLSEGATEAQREVNEANRQEHETVRQSNETARSLWENYDPTHAYVPGNKVYYLGSSYVNKIPCTGIPPTERANWQLVAQRGIDGGSPYDYAVAGGYTGTEEEFQALMGSGPWVPVFQNAGAHNSIFRGKFLGTVVAEDQYAAIDAGTFNDLYVGDFWTIDGVNWRIAAIDYFLYSGIPLCKTHHVVLVPDVKLYSAAMNGTHTTAGGYAGSDMYTNGLNQAKNMIRSAFSGHIMIHRDFFTNAVSNGRPSGGSWYDSEIDIMSEQMVYGGAVFAVANSGIDVPMNYLVGKSQLPLFSHGPEFANVVSDFWLRDIVSNSDFSICYYGRADRTGADYAYGVRPYFCIKG